MPSVRHTKVSAGGVAVPDHQVDDVVVARVDGRDRLEDGVERRHTGDRDSPPSPPEQRRDEQEDQEGVAGMQRRDSGVRVSTHQVVRGPEARGQRGMPPDLHDFEEPLLGSMPGRSCWVQDKREGSGERQNQHRRGEAEVECAPTHPEHEREGQRHELVNPRDAEQEPVVPAVVSDPEPLLQDARRDIAAEEPALEVEVRGEIRVRA